MKTETLHLKDAYPFLGENGCDPTVDIYLPYNMTEMHRENRKRPCIRRGENRGTTLIQRKNLALSRSLNAANGLPYYTVQEGGSGVSILPFGRPNSQQTSAL